MDRAEFEKAMYSLYSGNEDKGIGFILENTAWLAGISGVVEFINPLFDALERKDYYNVADIMLYEIGPKYFD